MAAKTSSPIKPDPSKERRYALFLLALLGYITRKAKEEEVTDLSTTVDKLLASFQTIQKEHDTRMRRAPIIVEQLFTEAASASVSRVNRAAKGQREEAPLEFDTAFDLNDAVSVAVAENVSLVRNLSQTYLDKIQAKVLEYHQTGKGNLAEELQKINGISKNRAKLIARDQMNKLHARIVQIKSQSLGSIGYQWRNMQDDRVRGNPQGKYPNVPPEKEHWFREGEYFLWEPRKTPPNAPNGKPYNQPPAEGGPGIPINCRCVTAPVFNFNEKSS